MNSVARGYIESRLVGAVQQHFNIGTARTMPVPVPPLDEQRRIAGVLGALDDLADLEDAQSERASQLAQAVVARSQNPVPLGEVAQEHRAPYKPEGITDHYSLPAFDHGLRPERVPGSQIKSSKNLLTNDCVLVSRLNPHIPRVWMAYPEPDVTSVASTEFVVIEADGGAVEWLWAATSAPGYLRQMQGRVTGTTGSHQRVDKSVLLQLTIPSPHDAPPCDRDAVVTLVREAAACRKESSRLRQTRDELLPLLMSGRVRAGEVDGVGSV
jgi:type I restriction enzyme, S subunit